MKVRRLHMTSFRGFRELNLEFNGPVTVLVGVNGAGKTSVLDCLAILLSRIPSKLLSPLLSSGYGRYWRRLHESDVHTGADHTLNTISVELGAKSIDWSLALTRRGVPKQVSNRTKNLDAALNEFRWSATIGQGQLPLTVFYPVNRNPESAMDSLTKYRQRPRPLFRFAPFATFDEALSAGARDFRGFFDWFHEREDLENEKRLREDARYRDPQLEAVRLAITRFVPGFSNLRIQRNPLRMLVQKGDGTIEVDQLSDGEKGLLTIAGDIGRRLAIANYDLDDVLTGEAVILIDEIELHLHPGWQRVVVERLQKTFPNCQFILTTHSPQVLSQVPAESVILLDHFQRVDLPARTQGRDSNAILSEVMGVSEWPPATAERIHTISQMIDREEITQAREALNALALQLGEHDSEVVRLRSLIDFLGV